MADRQRYVAVTRFTADATPEVKREFAVALVAALEACQVPQGDEFLVMDPEFLDDLRHDVDEARQEAQEAQDAASENADLIGRAKEIIRDFELGIRDLKELTEFGGELQAWGN